MGEQDDDDAADIVNAEHTHSHPAALGTKQAAEAEVTTTPSSSKVEAAV